MATEAVLKYRYTPTAANARTTYPAALRMPAEVSLTPRNTSSRATSTRRKTAVYAIGSRSVASVSMTMTTSHATRNSSCAAWAEAGAMPNQPWVSPMTSTA